ncbi:MAG: kinase/pyrophosphorylase [Gammaproteobacteria bacterium]|nr:kinase/pyrophosphorylase [Gammaproteobacteria bacterium]
MTRKIYFISDGTGITVETLGQSLLTQFSKLKYTAKKIPYVNTIKKAQEIADTINQDALDLNIRAIVISTLVAKEIREIIKSSNALVLDFFEQYISPLEQELGYSSDHTIGKTHSLDIANTYKYDARMDAINFALNTDDGLSTKKYDEAEVILIGVSRCGKTPSCLYMAIQYGIKAANYPLVIEDLEADKLPEFLAEYKHKIYGLSIEPKRLQVIRQKRRPNSQYADLKQCITEVKLAEALFTREKIPYLYTTNHSIEEITAHIIENKKINKLIT